MRTSVASIPQSVERAETFHPVPFTWRGFYRRKSEKVIAGEKESPERNEKYRTGKKQNQKRKFDLVVDIQEKWHRERTEDMSGGQKI